jgi:putative oxidoreductase
MAISFGLLILRVVIGLVVAAHGAQKLFGWFGGRGFASTIGWLQSLGFRPAPLWTVLAVMSEVGGGLLLALGFLTPLAAVGVFAAMLMATLKYNWSKGFWNTNGGYEYTLVLLGMALVAGIMGPGRYSIDALLNLVFSFWLFVVLLVLALIVIVTGLITSARYLSEQRAA